MGLGHTGVATEIINTAFGIILAAVAVALALAFGMGSRELAGRVAEEWMGPLLTRKRPRTRQSRRKAPSADSD